MKQLMIVKESIMYETTKLSAAFSSTTNSTTKILLFFLFHLKILLNNLHVKMIQIRIKLLLLWEKDKISKLKGIVSYE